MTILIYPQEVEEAGHHYITAIRWLRDHGILNEEKGVSHVTVSHDDNCPIFGGQACRCRPKIFFRGKSLKYPLSILGVTSKEKH